MLRHLGLNFSDRDGLRDPVFYIFNIGILFLNSQLHLVFKCNIYRYILVDCKIDGKHLCLSRRASAAFRLLNITVYKPNGSYLSMLAPNFFYLGASWLLAFCPNFEPCHAAAARVDHLLWNAF